MDSYMYAGAVTSKAITKRLKTKEFLNPNPGKAKVWSKQITVKAHKEILHCKLSILPNITDPDITDPSSRQRTRSLLCIVAQLSDNQSKELEEGRSYKLRVSCEVLTDKTLEVPEGLLVPFADKNGQLRYFQNLVFNKDLEESKSEYVTIMSTVQLHF